MPIVSVIIPTYGTPDRLERTVRSVLGQTLDDLELFVVDDNEPDSDARKETAEIMARFIAEDKRVKYLCHEHNKNGSAARNTGMRAASGKYISLLDSDDEYLPQRLEICVKTLEQSTNPKAQAVYTGCEYRKNDQTYRLMTGTRTGNFMVDFLRLSFNLYTGSNIFLAKAAADSLNGFDEAFIRNQDVEYMIRFFEKYDIIGVPDVLVIKNFDGKNKPSVEKLENVKKLFFEKFQPLIETLSKRDQRLIYGAHYGDLVVLCLGEKKYGKAFHYFKLVCCRRAFTLRKLIRFGAAFLRSLK